MKNFIRRHKYDVVAWFLIVAASIFFGLTYTTYRLNLDRVLFSNFDVRYAILVDGRIPKTISLGKIDPLNPFIYEPPYIERPVHNHMPQIVRFYPLTEEQQGTVYWYESGGGIREHAIAPAIYIGGKLLAKGGRYRRKMSIRNISPSPHENHKPRKQLMKSLQLELQKRLRKLISYLKSDLMIACMHVISRNFPFLVCDLNGGSKTRVRIACHCRLSARTLVSDELFQVCKTCSNSDFLISSWSFKK